MGRNNGQQIPVETPVIRLKGSIVRRFQCNIGVFTKVSSVY